jgi:alkylation response protein AidB-like acyl-CoA dehydrogenase
VLADAPLLSLPSTAILIVSLHPDDEVLGATSYREETRCTGVWASDAPPSRVTCEQLTNGEWRIEGIKQFCSGAAFADAALVTAHHADGILLFDLPIKQPSVIVQPTAWASPAFADTATTAVKFDSLLISDRYRLGDAGWYLNRPGFWHGSVGPAACWAGGAQSLIDAAVNLNRRDPHARAHVGALEATAWAFHAILEQAGREIDADPHDRLGTARIRGLKVRHLVERACADVLDRFARATGPHLLAHDAFIIRQHQALAALYPSVSRRARLGRHTGVVGIFNESVRRWRAQH